TPSYVVFTAGLAVLGLGFLFWLVDVMGRRRWAWPFVVFGMNAIAVYVAASIVPRLLNLIQITVPKASGHGSEKVGVYSFARQHYSAGLKHVSDWVANQPHMPLLATPQNINLTNALFLVLVIWVIMLVLYAFKVFIK